MSKDKVLERFVQNPSLRSTWHSVFPRMAFEAGSPTYAGYRKENTVNYITKTPTGATASMQYSPAPYDINMTLTVYASYFEDGLQIVEQILPFFQPEYTVATKEVPELGLERDVHVVLNSVTLEDPVEGDFEDGRIIEWTLDFTLKGFFYGPTVIKNIIQSVEATTFFTPEFDTPVVTDLLSGNITTGVVTQTTTENGA